MKIDKTEKEFREAINRGRVGLRVPLDDRVPFADALKAALDLEFKPEEPELPRRLSVVDGKISWGDSSPYPERREDVHREAAARYNAIPNILADLGKIAQDSEIELQRQHAESFSDLVKATLALEREKLQ